MNKYDTAPSKPDFERRPIDVSGYDGTDQLQYIPGPIADQPPPVLAVRLDCEALYVAIDRERRARRIRGQREVLRQAGILGPSCLTRIGQGHPPAADNLVRLLVWLGATDLGPFIARDGDQ